MFAKDLTGCFSHHCVEGGLRYTENLSCGLTYTVKSDTDAVIQFFFLLHIMNNNGINCVHYG